MSDVKQFLDKDGLNALWNKTCSTFIPNRPSTKFYPFIGTASRGTSYKVTLPYNGVTASYKLYMMNTMEIVLGSSYQKGATGKIFLSYYFTRDTNGTWLANDLRAFAIGCNVAPTITYQTNNPAIFWINLNSTTYNVISIKNLTAEDSAPDYDYRKTTIEAVTSTPTTGISSVPITILSNDGNKLKYNGNEIAVVNHTHDYLPLTGGTMTGPIVFNGTDSDRNIIRINNTTGDASKYGDFGFTLKYLGSGAGNNNALGLYSDDQSAPSQVMIARWMQDGTMYTRSITPFASNNYKLGTPDYRWAEIYTKRIYADNLYEGSQLLSDKYADKSYADYCSSYLHSANRAQFCNPAGVTIEYSTNGGSTWADYGASDEDKTALFSGCQKIQFKMGKGLSSLSSANDALRITMDASNMGLYTRCKCILLNVSENGNTNYRVKVETSLKGSPDTYTTIIENQRITGWSGWNRIPINNIAFGGGANQTSNTGRIRLTFMTDGLNPVYGYTSGMHATVIDMEILGDTYWSFPHTMAKTGHIYSWDAAGNTIFDKNVTANTFIGNLNGNATSANKTSALASVTNGNTTTSAGEGNIIYSRFKQDMLGSLPGGDNANGVITINTHNGDYHHQLGFTSSGMFYRRRYGSALNNSASWSKIAMISDIPADYARVGEGSIYIYPQHGNEINFGGTNTKTELYFGYRGVDSKPAPNTYIFGKLDSLANIKAKFVGNLTGKADTAGTADNATKFGGKSINAFMTYEDSTNYVNANFNDTTLDAKAASTYIEYWSSNGGWYNSKWGTVTAQNGFVGNIQGTLYNDTAYHNDPIVLKNIKFDNPGGYERSIVGSKVNNNRDFNIGIYGNYTSESTKSTYAWMGYNAYNGNNLRIYSDGKLQWGDYPIIHSNNIGSYKAGSTVGALTIAQPSGSTTFNGSVDTTININRTTLGLDKVMDYIGKTSITLSNGATTNPITIDSKSVTAVNGNVTIDATGREYIWNGSAWEMFGSNDIASSYKPKQTAVNDPTASGTSTTFIDTISQDANGKITVTKKNIPTIPTSLPWSKITGKPSFATVATTGSYNDLTNKPTIPAAVTVDASLSSTSTNPVQNKVINSALNNKMDKVTLAAVATTGSYNDLTNKPTIPTIPSSLPSNGIINAYTTNGIISPAISVSGAIRFDTMVCTQYLGNTNKFTGCNNAILSISRFDNNQYTTQLGFSGNGIYARIFNGKTPDTSTSWKTMIMDDGAGNVTANAFYISSDERLKTFGDDIKVDFDELAKLRKSHFVFNNNPTKQEIGVSAQEVQKIYPEIVNETEEGTLSVDYSKLAVVALAAIDKLNQRVQELENKLAKYE